MVVLGKQPQLGDSGGAAEGGERVDESIWAAHLIRFEGTFATRKIEHTYDTGRICRAGCDNSEAAA